jgi:long-subunit fatty acid transport protein
MEGTTKQGGFGMKKTVFVLLALLVVPGTLWAMDINQGTFELSGTTAFNFSDTETEVDGAAGDIDTTTWNLELDGNYYFMKNVGLGLILQYQDSEVEQGPSKIETSTFFIGPQIIYNIPLNEKVSLFAKGAVGYADAEFQSDDADGWGWQVGGGLKYFLTNSASINGGVTYQSLYMEDGGDVDTDGFIVGVGLSIYF